MTANFQAALVPPGKGSTYLLLGDLYSVLATAEDTGGAYGLLEYHLQPQSITPSHIHDEFVEVHYVLEGEIEYQLDEQTIVATPGTHLHIPKGQSHTFKNIGSKPAKILAWVTPAGGEQFFAEAGQRVNLPLNEEEQSLLGVVNPADFEKVVVIASKYARLVTS